MKAISLWQPWASLIATGAKRFETRSWSTNYRGPLLICAAKGGLSKSDLCDCLSEPEFRRGLLGLKTPSEDLLSDGIFIEDLPFGKAVAMVQLVACHRTERMTMEQIGEDEPFGNFSYGRYAWELRDIRPLKHPYPIKGAQGLFEIDDSVIAMILAKETEER